MSASPAAHRGWRISNTLDADFCVEALEEALSRYGRPEIFNTDQGSQFTSGDFTGTLKRHEVMISMDGKGRLHGQHLCRATVAQSQIRGGLPPRLCNCGRSQDWYWRLARFLQHGASAPEPRLSHTAAGLPGRPVDMWTIGVADRLCFPRFPSQLGKQGNARLRPHPHRHHDQQWI